MSDVQQPEAQQPEAQQPEAQQPALAVQPEVQQPEEEEDVEEEDDEVDENDENVEEDDKDDEDEEGKEDDEDDEDEEDDMEDSAAPQLPVGQRVRIHGLSQLVTLTPPTFLHSYLAAFVPCIRTHLPTILPTYTVLPSYLSTSGCTAVQRAVRRRARVPG